ncbi:CCR4-NOT regulatory complex component [Zygosaccharomyces mellis]|uniref:CCR4-NOT regulatory complex component n=1 Tax=Zygosaccharomyces mellis TaxID=42258 RepID=A0A4C2EH30_9SACH|nr:CCR4-NOT regulatory complex component [Zygosaccharomyces mellis]
MSLALEVNNLTYKFSATDEPSLVDINLRIPWNTRTLVVGANGAGKSTLLKVLSGKHLCLDGSVLVNGIDPFSPQNTSEDGELLTNYLGTEWCHMSIINRDIGVLELLESIGLRYYKERGEFLCNILDIDVNWRMFKLSDGQKRRVQLAMGLLRPCKVLLIDEVTVDLDVVARKRLLKFLEHETMTRKCSVIYATHIFDGLAQWPNQLIHMRLGRIVDRLDCDKNLSFIEGNEQRVDVRYQGDDVVAVSVPKVDSLYPLAVRWLAKDPQETKETHV